MLITQLLFLEAFSGLLKDNTVLYRLIRILGYLGTPIFFKKVEVNGRENIPTHNGFIIALNHQNSFLDAIIAAFFMNPILHFLTRSDVFVKPWSYLLRAVNMLPIYRMRDGIDKLSLNEAIFDKCFKVINDKGGVLIFSEANTDKQHFLRPLSKGTARMAIQAQEKADDPIYILPAAINYGDHDRSGHSMVLNFGVPIPISRYMDQYATQGPKTLNLLKKDLTDSLKKLMWLPDHDKDYEIKTQFINTRSTEMSFAAIKEKLQGEITLEDIAPQKSNMWRRICDLPHLPVIALIKWIIAQVKDDQFNLSIKFLGGLVLIPIYWAILCVVISYLYTPLAGLMTILGLFLLLLLRKF